MREDEKRFSKDQLSPRRFNLDDLEQVVSPTHFSEICQWLCDFAELPFEAIDDTHLEELLRNDDNFFIFVAEAIKNNVVVGIDLDSFPNFDVSGKIVLRFGNDLFFPREKQEKILENPRLFELVEQLLADLKSALANYPELIDDLMLFLHRLETLLMIHFVPDKGFSMDPTGEFTIKFRDLGGQADSSALKDLISTIFIPRPYMDELKQTLGVNNAQFYDAWNRLKIEIIHEAGHAYISTYGSLFNRITAVLYRIFWEEKAANVTNQDRGDVERAYRSLPNEEIPVQLETFLKTLQVDTKLNFAQGNFSNQGLHGVMARLMFYPQREYAFFDNEMVGYSNGKFYTQAMLKALAQQ